MGKRAIEPASMGIVTSDALEAGAKLRKRLLMGCVVLIVLGGLGAGGWYVWNKTSLLSRFRPATSAKTVVNYGNLTPAAAVKAAQAQVEDAHTSAEKQVAYTALGDAYNRVDDQASQTVAAYQQALTYSPDDIPLLERLSGTYERAGDTTDAVNTLHKLIDTINSTSAAGIDPVNLGEKDWLLSRYKAELKHETGDY